MSGQLRRGKMHGVKFKIFFIIILLLMAHLSAADDIVYTDREIIRNGDFVLHDTAWHQYWSDITPSADKDAGYGLRLEDLGVSDDRYSFQKLAIPSDLDSATIRFDYRAVEEIVHLDLPVVFQVSVAKSKGFDSANLQELSPLTTIGVIYQQTIDAMFDWREFEADLDSALIQAMQAAHDAGEFVFLVFSQAKVNDDHGYITDIDNISFKVDGRQRAPEMHGKIAYLEDNDQGEPSAISLLDPNNLSEQRIWTHPDGKFDTYSNIAWKPDASEIAFVSDHDFAFYVFKANIFSIKPDGSGLHRIPNLPSQEEIEDGDYPKVVVSGTLEFDTGDFGERYTVILGIQGTDKGAVLTGTDGERVPFTIADVPVLNDPDIFDQPFILHYYSTGCSGGIEYAFPMGMVTNGQVVLGTVKFFASNCIGLISGYQPHNLCWNRDGSELGFSLLGLKKVDPAATTEFAITEIEPDGGEFSDNLAWSPVDNRYLYLDFSLRTTDYEVFIAQEGGDVNRLLDDVEDVTPVWVPDGSGFLYVGWPEDERVWPDHNIYQYDLGTGQSRRLTYFRKELIEHLSISPDGRHVVFEKRDQILNAGKDLWILDRLNPVEIWPITDSGRCRNPDWSRTDMVAGNEPGDPDSPDNPGNPDNPGGGSGGGCFLDSCRY